MGTPLFHANEIMGELASLIETNLKASLGLKRVVRGSLRYHAGVARDLTTSEVPAIYIHPATVDFSFTAYRRHEGAYNMRLVYLTTYADNENVVVTRVQELEDIAELIVNNINLSSLTLTNGQVIFSAVRQIEYEPPEDEVALQLSQTFMAGAIQIEVRTKTTR